MAGTTTGTRRRCEHIKDDGTQCKSWAMTDSVKCFMHCPEKAAARADARSRGGLARQGRSVRAVRHIPGEPEQWPIQTMADVQELLEWAIADCLMMERSIARTNALGALIGRATKVLEQTEIEQRIAALEQISTGARVGDNGRY
ncbi:MAG: hypothetical protein K8S97_08505 [Anaerolineae bacterium]|nr:hypothetical protein [Anaerolineae bacterium]